MDVMLELSMRVMEHDAGSPLRVQHTQKVYAFARQIGLWEGLDERTQYILELAALLHDVGIRPALEKYGSSAGPLQEKEGPPLVRTMLGDLGVDPEAIERVAWLVGHHHTYTDVKGLDYQILLEADFLVNLFEDRCGEAEIRQALHKIFRTETGSRICRSMFGLEEET